MTDTAAGTLHTIRFPNESEAYRASRDRLLQAEIDLRRQTERVAALRRELPPGGEVPEAYMFLEGDGATPVRLSDLFGDKPTLAAYSFMFGPDMERACPSCTSILDALDGAAPHIAQRVSLVVIAKSPIARILAFARERGWRHLRLLSSQSNSYNRDYRGENQTGSQLPILNVFRRENGRIHHSYATELLFAPMDPGQDPRHVDAIWPLWSVLDLTPQGRGDFEPKLTYA
jgi:predicted dithiol-disulfide oxidoreductase (DUF899 family)